MIHCMEFEANKYTLIPVLYHLLPLYQKYMVQQYQHLEDSESNIMARIFDIHHDLQMLTVDSIKETNS